MSGAYDDLFNQKSGSGRNAWVDQISPEAYEWLGGLADECVKRGALPPVLARITEAFRERFPEDAPAAKSTVPDALKRLVKARG